MDSESKKKIEDAVSLWLATDEFSLSCCHNTAEEHLDSLLANSEEIERKEAQRLLEIEDRKMEYMRLAILASSKSKLRDEQIYYILKQADEWPFDLLEEAKYILKVRLENE